MHKILMLILCISSIITIYGQPNPTINITQTSDTLRIFYQANERSIDCTLSDLYKKDNQKNAYYRCAEIAIMIEDKQLKANFTQADRGLAPSNNPTMTVEGNNILLNTAGKIFCQMIVRQCIDASETMVKDLAPVFNRIDKMLKDVDCDKIVEKQLKSEKTDKGTRYTLEYLGYTIVCDIESIDDLPMKEQYKWSTCTTHAYVTKTISYGETTLYAKHRHRIYKRDVKDELAAMQLCEPHESYYNNGSENRKLSEAAINFANKLGKCILSLFTKEMNQQETLAKIQKLIKTYHKSK